MYVPIFLKFIIKRKLTTGFLLNLYLKNSCKSGCWRGSPFTQFLYTLHFPTRILITLQIRKFKPMTNDPIIVSFVLNLRISGHKRVKIWVNEEKHLKVTINWYVRSLDIPPLFRNQDFHKKLFFVVCTH